MGDGVCCCGIASSLFAKRQAVGRGELHRLLRQTGFVMAPTRASGLQMLLWQLQVYLAPFNNVYYNIVGRCRGLPEHITLLQRGLADVS